MSRMVSELHTLLHLILLLKPLYTSGRVHNLLRSGIKGVAGRTNLNMHISFGGHHFVSRSAGASHFGFFVFGVYSFFHFSTFVSKFSRHDTGVKRFSGIGDGYSARAGISFFISIPNFLKMAFLVRS